MSGHGGAAGPAGDEGIVARVGRGLGGGRLAVTALVTLLLSLGALISPTLLQFFSPAEIVLARGLLLLRQFGHQASEPHAPALTMF